MKFNLKAIAVLGICLSAFAAQSSVSFAAGGRVEVREGREGERRVNLNDAEKKSAEKIADEIGIKKGEAEYLLANLKTAERAKLATTVSRAKNEGGSAHEIVTEWAKFFSRAMGEVEMSELYFGNVETLDAVLSKEMEGSRAKFLETVKEANSVINSPEGQALSLKDAFDQAAKKVLGEKKYQEYKDKCVKKG